jgi:Ser/Thr protein kinase RdoA (MazF antagonist)
MSATAMVDPLVDPLATAYPFLDAAVLDDLVGLEVVASGLRHKPGYSTTATLNSPDGRPWGWAQVLLGDQPDKIANARRRASARGGAITVRPLPQGAGWFLCGVLGTDPRLHRARDVIAPIVPRLDSAIESGALHPLRYNALRRLVLRGSDHAGPLTSHRVLRLTAAHQGVDRAALGKLAGLGVPLVAPLREDGVPTSRRVTLWPWIDGIDLAAAPDRSAARAAGAALARLHEVTASAVGSRIASRLAPGEPADRTLRAVVEMAAIVAPTLERRLDAIVARMPSRPRHRASIIHGDFSADQVVRSAGEVRIVDLDRLQLGEPQHDLGSFAASELRRTGGWGLTGDLLAGYGNAARPHDLAAWTAHALLLRVTEPFRETSRTWVADMDRRLDDVERVLRDGVLP